MKPKSNTKGVPEKDRCQTPLAGALWILPYLDTSWTIWEPAAGAGLLSRAIRDYGCRTIESDILTGQDFFQYQPSEEWEALVTNPPFSIKYKWLGRCYELGKPFALLMPVDVVGAQSAQALFDQYGVEILFPRGRINFVMPNKGLEGKGAQFATAWFTWKLNLGAQMLFPPKPSLYRQERLF